jgi:prepilin-type processing-associated H-X9-DG protein
LLVVIIIIAILASLLLPVLSKAKQTAQKTQCLNNMKQLQLCWQLYADDYQGRLITNLPSNPQSWVTGDMNTAQGATNLADIKGGGLYYYNKSVTIYKCPSAKGTNPRPQSGLDASKLVRTVSMTPRMGNYLDHDQLTDTANNTPQIIIRLSQITIPGPAQATVLVDESVATIDDSFFAIDSALSPESADPFGFQNSPTIRHGGGGTFSYADGHVGLIAFPNIHQEPFPTSGLTAAQTTDWLNLYHTIYPSPP